MHILKASVGLLFCITFTVCSDEEIAKNIVDECANSNPADPDIDLPQWDNRGYIIFCPCMGRFGNQADHYLGAIGFAKAIDRTLILPPFRTYKNIPFDEWFQVKPLKQYHRVILADDFMNYLAPKYWPPEKRSGWCWLSPSAENKDCAMKQGNPFGPFWDGLGVDFVDSVIYHTSYEPYSHSEWRTRYPPEKYPVMAFRGAPAAFPIKEAHIPIHQYLKWSDTITKEVDDYINKTFHGQPFVGIHLRTNKDWVTVCNHADGQLSYMASPQCLGYSNKDKKIHIKMCYPPKEEILRLTKNIVLKTKAKHVFIATDRITFKTELEDHLSAQKVEVHHFDPHLPQIDLAILGRADHAILNCVSSFSAFVKRERDVNNMPTSFWGMG